MWPRLICQRSVHCDGSLCSGALCSVGVCNTPENSGCGSGSGLRCPVQHVLMLLVSRLRTPELDRAT